MHYRIDILHRSPNPKKKKKEGIETGFFSPVSCLSFLHFYLKVKFSALCYQSRFVARRPESHPCTAQPINDALSELLRKEEEERRRERRRRRKRSVTLFLLK